ncbi:MAG: aminopeptidase P family protein [Oscillospiraceae bacterium]|nr:aminopeptidase P family protein [Oscillospiraceae bacterium]
MSFYKEKMDIAFQAMRDNDFDMWIVAGQESATNSEPVLDVLGDAEFIGCTALVYNRDGSSAVICTPLDMNGYIHAGVFTEVIDFPVSFEQSLGEYIKKKAPKNIALNFSLNNPASDGLTVGNYRMLQKAFAIAGFEGEIVSAQPIVNMVRGIKLPHEIEKIKKACAVTQEIFDAAKDFIKPGMNCQDIYKFFEDEVARRRVGYSWPKSCNPGVFSGYGCPSGHMGAPDFPVKAGDVVNIDFGIIVDGYASDMQRMYYLLEPGETDAPEEVKKAFYCVRDSIQKAADALKPGVTGLEVDTICRESILAGGYDSYGFATGHQLGRVAHDGGPLLGPRKPRYDRPDLIEVPLMEGFVFTLEPGVETSRGHLGMEEDVVVRENGAEFLVEPQRELYLIG